LRNKTKKQVDFTKLEHNLAHIRITSNLGDEENMVRIKNTFTFHWSAFMEIAYQDLILINELTTFVASVPENGILGSFGLFDSLNNYFFRSPMGELNLSLLLQKIKKTIGSFSGLQSSWRYRKTNPFLR